MTQVHFTLKNQEIQNLIEHSVREVSFECDNVLKYSNEKSPHHNILWSWKDYH